MEGTVELIIDSKFNLFYCEVYVYYLLFVLGFVLCKACTVVISRMELFTQV